MASLEARLETMQKKMLTFGGYSKRELGAL